MRALNILFFNLVRHLQYHLVLRQQPWSPVKTTSNALAVGRISSPLSLLPRQAQMHPLLDYYAELLRNAWNDFSPSCADLVVSTSLDFVTGLIVDYDHQKMPKNTVDFVDVSYLLNFDLPTSSRSYTHNMKQVELLKYRMEGALRGRRFGKNKRAEDGNFKFGKTQGSLITFCLWPSNWISLGPFWRYPSWYWIPPPRQAITPNSSNTSTIAYEICP